MPRSVDRCIRLSTAAGLLGLALSSTSPVLGASLERGKELAERERYEDARAVFDALPAELRDDFGARLLDEDLKVHEGSVEEAAGVFRNIVRARPNRPEARVNFALLDARRWGIVRSPESMMLEMAGGERDRAEAWWKLHDVEVHPAARTYRRAGVGDAPGSEEGARRGSGELAGLLMPSTRTESRILHSPEPGEQDADARSDDGRSESLHEATEGPSARIGGETAAALSSSATIRRTTAKAAVGAEAVASAVRTGDDRPTPDGTRVAAADRGPASSIGADLREFSTGSGTERPRTGSGARTPDNSNRPNRHVDSRAPSRHALLKALAFAAGTMAVLASLGGLVLVLRRRHPRDRALRRRLQQTAALLGGPAPATEAADADESIFRPAEATSSLSVLWRRVEARYPLVRVREAFPVATGAAVAGAGGSWFSMWFLQVPTGWWTTPISLLAGAGAVWYALAWLQSRREAEFVRQFPEMVDQIVRLAGAGVPPLEALGVVAEDAPDPIGPILGSVRDSLLAGLDADTTLRSAAERIRLGEFTLFAAVIRLQRRAGGGISSAFSNLSNTLRERRKTALKAHASTAQSRLTLLVLILMPIVVLLAQRFIAPKSVEMLFETETGVTLLRWGVGLVVAGILVARKISARAIS